MKSKNSRKIIVHILLLLGITITVFPFVWMILTSFKTVGEAMQIKAVQAQGPAHKGEPGRHGFVFHRRAAPR